MDEVRLNVIIQVREDVAFALSKRRSRNKEARELSKAAKELGVELKQMHPNTKNPTLASYYFVEVSDPSEAERIKERFRVFRAAEAVYVKPPDELP